MDSQQFQYFSFDLFRQKLPPAGNENVTLKDLTAIGYLREANRYFGKFSRYFN